MQHRKSRVWLLLLVLIVVLTGPHGCEKQKQETTPGSSESGESGKSSESDPNASSDEETAAETSATVESQANEESEEGAKSQAGDEAQTPTRDADAELESVGNESSLEHLARLSAQGEWFTTRVSDTGGDVFLRGVALHDRQLFLAGNQAGKMGEQKGWYAAIELVEPEVPAVPTRANPRQPALTQ